MLPLNYDKFVVWTGDKLIDLLSPLIKHKVDLSIIILGVKLRIRYPQGIS
jgi:hypothetical protein